MSSIIFGFFTHLVETGILKEGHWPAVHVYSLSRVWPQSWARELRFKTETLDLGLVLTLMCTQGHKNGFQVEEPVWNLAQVFVPSVKIQEWSSATKKKKSFLFLCSPFPGPSFKVRLSRIVKYSKHICFLARSKVSGTSGSVSRRTVIRTSSV